MPPHNLIEPPPPAELRQLYEVEQVRHGVVAAKYGVSKTTAKRWAREANIAYPHTRGKAHTPEAGHPWHTPLDLTAPKRPRGRPRKDERITAWRGTPLRTPARWADWWRWAAAYGLPAEPPTEREPLRPAAAYAPEAQERAKRAMVGLWQRILLRDEDEP